MAGLLAGLRVLDLTNVLAGPFCCYQLAQLGAEVIKVETPGTGDLARQLGADPELNRRLMGASFLAQNAGKRSITLNLKNAKAREAFTRLVKTSDVVVENFRPGVMERLELGYERLKAIKPDLIYCAISGFGQDGPLRLNPAYDQIIQGLSGVMSVTGDAQSAPLRVGYPVADTMGGITAAYAISAALFRRERSGEGEFIDVSMLESTLVAMGWVVSNWLIAGVRPRAAGQREHDGKSLGHVPHRRGLAQHRGEPAAAVRDAVPADRPAGACRRSALCRPRGSKAPSRRAHRGDRAGAGGAPGGGMVKPDERQRRAGRRGARRARGAGASADRRARTVAHLQRCAGCRRRRQRGALRLPAQERRSRACVAAARCSAPTPKVFSPNWAIPRARSRSCRATRRSSGSGTARQCASRSSAYQDGFSG